ncbi:MAG TPA: class I SAM-dependent methyltransferase [Puia sp.]|jgi:ubiquinone/menaquinone biosynthesis C-methylase UbiE|nr:class I SAM-dependent methyltransferase [Puia sp.]
MKISSTYSNEQLAADAFSKQSFVFDEIYSNNTIINYKRERVRNHVLNFLPQQSKILELNSGTGEDAIFFAGLGHHVTATDISEGMQNVLKQKIAKNNLQNNITTELCSFTELNKLQNKGPYDLIFSNFAGLNCTNKLSDVLASFNSLLKPHGVITLVMLPKFCLWETGLLAKGKFKTATRRFFSKRGRKARVENIFFSCWYYNPSYIIKKLRQNFEALNVEGLCTIVPPSYIGNFAEKHPGAWKYLKDKEEKYKNKWPWKFIGDYYIISLRKKAD